ncbi:MAG TPA: hypothetical protein VF294_13925, partial [Polyangiaceae bacterium]
DQIQRRIEVLKKQIAAEKAAPPPTTGATAPATPVVPATTTPTQPEPAPTAHTGKRPVAPLIVAGAGGVVLIVGAVVYAGGAKDVSHYEGLCPNHNCTGPNATADQDAANKARTKKITGGVVAGVGAAAVAGGLIWYFVQPRSAETTGSLLKPNVIPAVTPGFAGLALSGAF